VRGTLSHDNQLCMTGCGDLETAQHLFLSCPRFASLCDIVRSWLDLYSADPYYLQEHACYLVCLFIRRFASTSIFFAASLALCYVWVLCNERNHRIFKNIVTPIHQLLDKMKLFSFWWMKPTNINIRHNFHMWWSSPFVCLDIG